MRQTELDRIGPTLHYARVPTGSFRTYANGLRLAAPERHRVVRQVAHVVQVAVHRADHEGPLRLAGHVGQQRGQPAVSVLNVVVGGSHPLGLQERGASQLTLAVTQVTGRPPARCISVPTYCGYSLVTHSSQSPLICRC
eukprot:scaffold98583_cov51-Prasinocladus_malaysianus.AAC.1